MGDFDFLDDLKEDGARPTPQPAPPVVLTEYVFRADNITIARRETLISAPETAREIDHEETRVEPIPKRLYVPTSKERRDGEMLIGFFLCVLIGFLLGFIFGRSW